MLTYTLREKSMSTAERVETRLSFYGRLTDDLTRRAITAQSMIIRLEADGSLALLKDDGHFCFVALEPSNADYTVKIIVPSYQERTVAKAFPGSNPVELSFPGDDELYVSVKQVNAGQKRVTFEEIPF